MGLGKIYTFGPTFRAEHSNTTRHVAEFWQIEPEVCFCDLNDIIKYLWIANESAFLTANTASKYFVRGLKWGIVLKNSSVFIRAVCSTPVIFLNMRSSGCLILGVHKWEKLGLDYPLKGTPPLGEEKLRELNELL